MSATKGAETDMSASDITAPGAVDILALARGDVRPAMADTIAEGRRQIEVCNACRYCEGYCAVFPAMTLHRAFSDGDMLHLANLCHNCRGCYYACQYAPPHEFAINIPRALAEIRTEGWAETAWPRPLAQAFERNGTFVAMVLTGALAAFLMALSARGTGGSIETPRSFYDVMPHGAMASLFGGVFALALAIMGVSLVKYWRVAGSAALDAPALGKAIIDVVTLRNLRGGHNEGCNFEAEDVFTTRRWQLHQAMFIGFMLCFASTLSGTILHYVFAMPAPYGPFSLPKLLGVPGGLLLAGGTIGLMLLKRRSDPLLASRGTDGMDRAFSLLLCLTAVSGLALYWFAGIIPLRPLLAVHLGAVMALFLTLPYSRMVHGVYRFAALVRHAHDLRVRKPTSA
jgi:citrate/tricarballylate utilization protein